MSFGLTGPSGEKYWLAQYSKWPAPHDPEAASPNHRHFDTQVPYFSSVSLER